MVRDGTVGAGHTVEQIMWNPARSQWIVIWCTALLAVVLLGDPRGWRFALATPDALATAKRERLTALEVSAYTDPTRTPSEREVLLRQRLRRQSAAQIARARRHMGLSIAGLAFLVVWWLGGRSRH